MNYRHHFHAGNFADVLKHVVMLQLIRGLQRKEKGFLHLDTHAGRGAYDLATAARGDTLERKPEWPEGIGRIQAATGEIPLPVQEYRDLVNRFAANRGLTPPGLPAAPGCYPGSPHLAALALRPQDRLALCELHPEEFALLENELSIAQRCSVQLLDGYTGLKAQLPPPEKRALVLIDPPFEAQDEFSRIATGLREGLRRSPSATFAVWYPLTGRARIDAFFDQLRELDLPPCFAAELCIAGEQSAIRMRGCGMLILNPPWKLDEEIQPLLPWLCDCLAQEDGAEARLDWLVEES